jgi:DNA-directed RNA polymerase subunit N (RpoN/RPB10)
MAATITLHAPIYLLSTATNCWSCGRVTAVYAVAAARVDDDEGTPCDDDEPVLLHRITELPVEITDAMAAHGGVLRLQASKTAGMAYLANQCSCGALIGDHYLSSEPGGPFFPIDAAGVAAITATLLPCSGSFNACAEYSMGGVGEMLESR